MKAKEKRDSSNHSASVEDNSRTQTLPAVCDTLLPRDVLRAFAFKIKRSRNFFRDVGIAEPPFECYFAFYSHPAFPWLVATAFVCCEEIVARSGRSGKSFSSFPRASSKGSRLAPRRDACSRAKTVRRAFLTTRSEVGCEICATSVHVRRTKRD